jgi:hypothetical protein
MVAAAAACMQQAQQLQQARVVQEDQRTLIRDRRS